MVKSFVRIEFIAIFQFLPPVETKNVLENAVCHFKNLIFYDCGMYGLIYPFTYNMMFFTLQFNRTKMYIPPLALFREDITLLSYQQPTCKRIFYLSIEYHWVVVHFDLSSRG